MAGAITIDASKVTKDRAVIMERLNTLYATRAGTVGLCRDFGLPWAAVDAPTEAARAQLNAVIIERTRKYVPEVRVEKITWSTENGELAGKVCICDGEY